MFMSLKQSKDHFSKCASSCVFFSFDLFEKRKMNKFKRVELETVIFDNERKKVYRQTM